MYSVGLCFLQCVSHHSIYKQQIIQQVAEEVVAVTEALVAAAVTEVVVSCTFYRYTFKRYRTDDTRSVLSLRCIC
jgi:hypothetical protein